MRKLYVTMTFMFICCAAFAQQKLTGTVLEDPSLEPLIGVAIQIKGTATGTVTDLDGKFTIQASPGDVLVISYLGMITQNVTVKSGMNNLSVKMLRDALNLDEVVVVGYGITRKRDLAGAITSLKVDDIKAGVVTNTAQLLKGRAAGVLVRQNSGEPGGGISIRVRGASSISSNNEPLYVIDGFQTDLGNQINPNDIQSIEILKDAAATAIYGARGANGVVLISTKKGTAGLFSVSYSYDASMKSLSNPWELMNAQDIMGYAMNTWKENGASGNAPYTDEQLKYIDDGTDWVKEVTKQALTQTHQFSITGGSDKMSMAISGNYLDDMGILMNTDFNRFSGRMNLDYKLTDRVRFGANVYMARSNKNFLNMGDNAANNNVIYSLFMMSPFTTKTGDDVFGNKGKKPGIFSELNDVDFESVMNNVYGTLYGEADLLKTLTARVQYTYSNDNRKDSKYYPKVTNIGKANDGLGSIQNYKNDNQQLDVLLTYHQTLAKIHNLKVLVGSTLMDGTSESNGMEAYGFSTDEFSFNNMGGAKTINWISSAKEQFKRLSFFGRVEYVLKDKYIFNASYRADGASNFGPGEKWGYFPSGSLAWQLGEEQFMEFAKPILSSLKLRASYGITGNDGIGNYLSQAKFGMTNVYLGGDAPVKGLYPSNPANDNLKWESTSQLNLGIDLSLFNKRLEINFDYYNKITSDLLNPVAVSSSTGGFETMMGNNGKIRNRGIELFIKSNNLMTKNFGWITTLNISRNKNKVLELNKGEARYESISPQGWYNFEEYAVLKEGWALSSLYGYVFEGIIQTGETYSAQPTAIPGDPKFKDLDGDGTITNKDRKVIGDGNPDVVLGMGNNFTIRDFDFSFFLDASIGNNLLNLSRVVLEDEGRLKVSMDKWTTKHPSNEVPRNGYKKNAGIKYGSYINSRFVENASYLRLQNIELGYTLPVKRMAKFNKYVKNFRMFVGAQNLFTITQYTGFNPEVSTKGGSAVAQGLDFSSYPAYKTFNFGAKITF